MSAIWAPQGAGAQSAERCRTFAAALLVAAFLALGLLRLAALVAPGAAQQRVRRRALAWRGEHMPLLTPALVQRGPCGHVAAAGVGLIVPLCLQEVLLLCSKHWVPTAWSLPRRSDPLVKQ